MAKKKATKRGAIDTGSDKRFVRRRAGVNSGNQMMYGDRSPAIDAPKPSAR